MENKEYLDKIVNIIEKPYYKEMGYYGIIDIYEQEYILSKIFNDNITLDGEETIGSDNHLLYREYSDGVWSRYEFKNNEIYYENSDGYWEKTIEDEWGNRIYRELNTGYWVKREYDENGIFVSSVNSYGEIVNKIYGE